MIGHISAAIGRNHIDPTRLILGQIKQQIFGMKISSQGQDRIVLHNHQAVCLAALNGFDEFQLPRECKLISEPAPVFNPHAQTSNLAGCQA